MDNEDSTSKPSGPPRRGRPPKGDRPRTAPSSAGESPSPDAIAVEDAEAAEPTIPEPAAPPAEVAVAAPAPEPASARTPEPARPHP